MVVCLVLMDRFSLITVNYSQWDISCLEKCEIGLIEACIISAKLQMDQVLLDRSHLTGTGPYLMGPVP